MFEHILAERERHRHQFAQLIAERLAQLAMTHSESKPTTPFAPTEIAAEWPQEQSG